MVTCTCFLAYDVSVTRKLSASFVIFFLRILGEEMIRNGNGLLTFLSFLLAFFGMVDSTVVFLEMEFKIKVRLLFFSGKYQRSNRSVST